MDTNLKIEPQKGQQSKFLSTHANIAIYGGAAGGGKSFSLLLEGLRNCNNPNFNAVIFRRETPQITNPGGLFDEANSIYLTLGAKSNITNLYFEFPSGMTIKFAHLEQEKTIYAWQGSQIALIGFDELTHFTEKQFFYMLSRNRSMSGVPGYIRATTNPDPDSWVANFLSWWISDDGYPIPERDGVLRWFIRKDDKFIWDDFKFNEDAKSVTFISAKLTDNKILLEKDPNYKSNLEALSYVDRMRLLYGNWKIRAASGNYFKRQFFEIIDYIPINTRCVRYWDRASSISESSDYTAGVKMHIDNNKNIYIENISRFKGTPHIVQKSILNIAKQDGINVQIGIEQDPGQAGVVDADVYLRLLIGFNVKLNKVITNKVQRASPLSAYCESGNVKLLRGPWIDEFISELESFPDGKHDDQVDAASGAFNMLTQGVSGSFSQSMIDNNYDEANTLVSEII